MGNTVYLLYIITEINIEKSGKIYGAYFEEKHIIIFHTISNQKLF
jgi:hypothetical protein